MGNESRWVSCLIVTIATAAIGGWQYVKYIDKHGLFYYLSPKYGAYILLGCLICMLTIAIWIVLSPSNGSGSGNE